MERITCHNSRGKTLVGNLYPASKDSLIIMAHGLISDKSSQGRFEVYANKFVEAGISALAFDFTGAGESDDETLSIETEVDDLRSFIIYMRSQGYHNIGLYGHSIGALICLKVYRPDIATDIITIAITGGITGPVHFKWEDIFSADQMQELLEKGSITADASSQNRSQVIIDGQLLNNLPLIDQRILLSNIRCPVLLIHGDGDEEEQTLYEVSQAGMNYLPAGSELKLIPGATHNFWNNIDQVAGLLQNWFSKHLVLNK